MRCKPQKCVPTPPRQMCRFPPLGPHPRYNELDGGSRLHARPRLNTLGGLVALCEEIYTDLLCCLSPDYGRSAKKKKKQKDLGALFSEFSCKCNADSFPPLELGAERPNSRAGYGLGVTGERRIPAQCLSNHVLAREQLSSAEERWRKMYWLQRWENVQTFMPRQNNE